MNGLWAENPTPEDQGWEAEDATEKARAQIAKLIGADPKDARPGVAAPADLSISLSLSIYIYIYMYINKQIHLSLSLYIYIYIYAYRVARQKTVPRKAIQQHMQTTNHKTA